MEVKLFVNSRIKYVLWTSLFLRIPGYGLILEILSY